MITNNEKKCWACKRIMVDDAKFGLCPKCLNKYGSPVIAAGVVGIAAGGKMIIKNKDKVIKTALSIVKNIRV